MPKGGRLIIKTFKVELREGDRLIKAGLTPGEYVTLTVRDTGRGMTDEVKAKIFEPFFTTKEVGKGTGLGLATVYGVLKQSGGHIIVSSEPEKGSTFVIYLPRVKGESVSSKRSANNQGMKRGVETILLVEDDEVVRTMTREILETAGYKVLVANNTDHAVDICKQYKETIHLLLTDVVMPKESGQGLAEKLRKLRPQMKVLYMSVYTDDAIVNRGVWEKGMKFQKPYTLDSITRGVRDALDA
jgi:CheY-like chemotaxis protein